MKLKYITLAAVAALMSFSSCSDYLDKIPDTRVDIQTPEQLRLLLVDGYSTSNYAMIGELSSDNVIDNNSLSASGVRYNLGGYDKVDDEVYAWDEAKASISGGDTPSGVWTGAYNAIAVANHCLENLEKMEASGMTDKTFPWIRGEALMIRAYNHFILAQFFCQPYRGEEINKTLVGIPYVTKPETEVLPQYDRGNLADTYAKIREDLETALPLINDELYEIPKFHFNKAASYSFAAQFYLFTRDYEKALECANVALGGANADVSANTNTIWKNLANFYYISDFGRFSTNITNPRNFMLISNYSQWWRRLAGSNRYTCNRDAKRATIQGAGPCWKNCKYISSKTKETFAMHPAFASSCGTSGGQEYGAYFAGNCFELFEYTDKVSGIGYTHYVRAEFTVEQTLLNRAEAKLFLGDIDGAAADLKVWADSHWVDGDDRLEKLEQKMIPSFYNWDKDPGFGIMNKFHIDEVCPSDRYHMTEAIEPYMQCVQHFRRIEQVHTGGRFLDIKRFGFEITHKIGLNRVETLTTCDPRCAIQIPSDVISAGMEANDRTQVKPVDQAKYKTETYEKAY